VSPQKSKKTLINWDLVSVNPNDKNWDWKDLFCFWGVNIQSVIGFSLITSLYVIYDLNTYIVLFGTILGSLFVYIFATLVGKPSQKFGLPFVVLLRSSLGIRGAKYFGFLRGLVGIFMFGVQTYFLSKAFGYLIRVVIFSFEPSILNHEIFLTFLLGLNILDWISFILVIILQTLLFSAGMIFNKKLIQFSALSVYFGMILFFFSVFLSDVKFTTEAFVNSLNNSNFLDLNNLVPLITVAGTVFAYFSIIILSFGDFSRYVKNESELKKGNLSLILNLFIFSLFALFIVTGVDAFLKENPDNLSRILTNPTDIIGSLNNLIITNLALIFIIIASASTNLIANFIPSQYTLINLIPSSLSLRSSSFIIAFAGFFIGIFWLTYLIQI
jgi:nucleobase:cation symporter-1, NCS1 family